MKQASDKEKVFLYSELRYIILRKRILFSITFNAFKCEFILYSTHCFAISNSSCKITRFCVARYSGDITIYDQSDFFYLHSSSRHTIKTKEFYNDIKNDFLKYTFLKPGSHLFAYWHFKRSLYSLFFKLKCNSFLVQMFIL